MTSALHVRAPRAIVVAVLVGVATGGCSTPGATSETVEVRIRHSRFVPEEISVARGVSVRFVVRNDDPIDHEFILGDEAVQDRHERGTETHHGERRGEVSVAAGATVTTSFTFDRPGVVLLGCHLPGHYEYGMRGRVVVA